LQHAQPAQFGEDFFGRALAYMAGVEDDEIGQLRRLDRGKPQRIKQILHPAAVIHVHLAAPGDHVQTPPGSGSFGLCRVQAMLRASLVHG
jgi:hypothetical protein